LKSKLGKGILSGSFAGEHQLFGVYCIAGDGPDVTATWTPPHTGTFFVGARGSSSVSITTWTGDCTEMGASTQCSVTNPGEYTTFNFMDTKPVTIVIRPATNITGSYSLDITDVDPTCDSGDCAPIGPVTPPAHDGGVTSAAAALCLANARARNDEICAGTECACSHCPQDYDDCGVIPGCNDIRACMTDRGCIGADCYISGQCRKVIDTNGSIGGPAFRAASGLQSCVLSLGCGLPCSRGGAADAGDSGAVDAGLACTPRRPVSCPCEGGVSGTKVCKADGSGFGQCVCDEPPLTPINPGGCECSVGGRGAPAGAAFAVLGAAALLSSRRRRSSPRIAAKFGRTPAKGVGAPLAATPLRSWQNRSRSENERGVGRPARPVPAAFGWEESHDQSAWSGAEQKPAMRVR
jgi:MYXO-CTERM domain-containing protein